MDVYNKSRLGLLIAAVILLFLVFASPLQATASSRYAGPAPAQSGKRVSFNGISFAYDKSLASDVSAHVVPKDEGGPNQPCWATHPDETVFEFRNFAFATTNRVTATIYVVPVDSDYQCLNPADIADYWQREVVTLRDLLTRRPKLTEPTTAQGTTPIPFLPPINAAGFLVGKQEYLDFRNGSGLRYLIQFTQQPIKPSHENAFYTYQGLSSDGKYYVSMIFPAFLATPLSKPLEQFATQKEWDNFYSQLRAMVDGTANRDFQPNLDMLDSIATSLSINSPAVILPSGTQAVAPGLPRTGSPMSTSTGQVPSAVAPDLALLVVLAVVLMRIGLALRRMNYELSDGHIDI